jgi:phenylpyruvate tautomerase PptA (4-oxalocrotonate tautomerase family)
MPRIYVDWFEGKTAQQREETARRITDVVVQVAKVAPEEVTIVFREFSRELLFKAGKGYQPVRSAGS